MKISSDEKQVLYFAYGSNMNPGQMAARCARARVATVARLPDHAISFFGHSDRWDGGEETAVRRVGAQLFGVIYRLSPTDADRLDAAQGVRLNGTGSYFHYPATVFDQNGQPHAVVLYKKDVLQNVQSPSGAYLDHIIAGAVFHALPEDYIDGLRKTVVCQARYPVPLPQADYVPGGSCAC